MARRRSGFRACRFDLAWPGSGVAVDGPHRGGGRPPRKTSRETGMSNILKGALIAAGLFAAGCQSQQQIVDSMEPDAVHVAQRRGAFELNCPAATASMLSKEMIQSPNVNPRFAPPQRAEYTVGVSGCGQRATYMVICAEGGTGCFAGGSRNTVRQ